MPIDLIGTRTGNDAEDARAARDAVASATNAQIDAAVDAAVTDLASARAYLKRLTRVVRTLSRRVHALEQQP